MTGLLRDNFKMKSLFTQIFAMGYVFIQEDTILNFLARKKQLQKEREYFKT